MQTQPARLEITTHVPQSAVHASAATAIVNTLAIGSVLDDGGDVFGGMQSACTVASGPPEGCDVTEDALACEWEVCTPRGRAPTIVELDAWSRAVALLVRAGESLAGAIALADDAQAACG